MTTRTAVTCPAHGRVCVCVFVIEPDSNNVATLALPQVYASWVDRIDGRVVAVEHHPADLAPDMDLVGITALAPFEAINKLREDHEELKRFARRGRRRKRKWDKQ